MLSAATVRERAQRMLALGLDDKLPHFRVDLAQLPKAVDLVLDITRKNYPALDVPFHSRWRHFVWNGEDRWASLDRRTRWPDTAARARATFDLAIVSVLLDAGAGPQWHYRDPVTQQNIGRSEGLALASLAMFAEGAFSSDPKSPLQADAQGLTQFSDATLARGFQVTASNPLVGVEGRGDLLRRLGTLIASEPDIFGCNGATRPGGLFDHYAALAVGGDISAPTILSGLLRHLGPIWPSRLTLGGVPLGDCWRHPSMTTADATNGLVPLHKLSQWLAYSLIEPLQWSGLTVSDIDGLTGLSEYRNGGLFVDTGVLRLRDPADAERGHDVASALVVEWRTLTVALLDRLADEMRRRLGMDAQALPLAKVLEGGSWAAGRVIARQKRADGSPPLKVISDGTVF
ncbi:MAG: URC4/urg3 family protein [Xanthobacteraceae bacterium]